MTFEQWKQAVQKISFFKQSAQLKDLTAKYEIQNQRATPTNAAALKKAFDDWTKCAAYAAEKMTIGAPVVASLQTLVATGLGATVVSAVKASGVLPIGYTLYKPGDAAYELDGDMMLPLAQRLPDLTTTEIQRVNEAIRRCKLAVEAARDLLIPVALQSALSATPSQGEKLFVDYFGAFDQARAKTVVNNYKKLHEALSGAGPIIFDHRNTDFGEDCFAACKKNNWASGTRVKVWFGRDFFTAAFGSGKIATSDQAAEAYARTSDATVGTLVHEFSHGTFRAVDAPPVTPGGNWVLAPSADWESPDNDVQSSTRELDKRLASKEPRAAIVNADNYGQMATEALALKHQ